MRPPNHALVRAEGHTPEVWMLFLHGILGSGANLRTLARRFVQARPRWGAVLVDLRKHGASQDFAPPHTVVAAAADLDAISVGGPIRGVWGHSFGGKVALQYASEHDLDEVVLVDSNPGLRLTARGSESTMGVLAMLGELPEWWDTRQAFIDEVQRRGQPLAIAQWLAMNLERGEHGVRFGLDLAAIRALLDDYFSRDLWSVLEHPRSHIVVINGGRSDVFDEQDLARLGTVVSDRVEVHVVAQAGHWVHAEAPDELQRIMIESIR